ncbi:hypothetical protein GCM10011579_088940 [Streptomyces albiflavescens]|uniref:Uncharacterized protein n=1 Tax=Streptomyces albiflavescens TaxID=1623582 RepID=A0A918DAR3_9ACTN|nr:hypothetical protein [Streptomyces albiflavescens]GGN91767.1 hypothetical protein GCM10011579_088940 [Streptomyces albiflavescens]
MKPTDAVRVDGLGLGLDTARKPDRNAFIDAVAWLTERGALTLADGSATAGTRDPERPTGGGRFRGGSPCKPVRPAVSQQGAAAPTWSQRPAEGVVTGGEWRGVRTRSRR